MQSDQEHLTEPSTPPILTQSMEAFYRDLPELLRNHDRMWVAYHGNEILGVSRTQTELYHKCLQRGLKQDEFVVLFADNQALSDHDVIDLPWPR